MPGEVQYTIAADAARFLGGFQTANTALGQGIGFIQRHAAALASLAGVSMSAAGMLSGFKDALDMGGGLSDLSARTGQSVKDLVILRQAFENAGVGADSVGPRINLMQKALAGISEEGEPTNKIFERLGLNMAELKASSATEALQAISDKISALPTAAERAEASMKIFGRSGGSMLALLTDKGALGDAATMVGGQAEILARNAAIFDRASDILNASGVKLKGFFVGLADKVTPQLMPLLERFNKMDFSAWGQKIGDAINVGIGAFKAGKMTELLGLAFNIAVLKLQGPLLTGITIAVNAFTAGMIAAVQTAGDLLVTVVKNAGTILGNAIYAAQAAPTAEALKSNKAEIVGRIASSGDEVGALSSSRWKSGGGGEANAFQSGYHLDEVELQRIFSTVGSFEQFKGQNNFTNNQQAASAYFDAVMKSILTGGTVDSQAGANALKAITDKTAESFRTVGAAMMEAAKNTASVPGAGPGVITAEEAKLKALMASFAPAAGAGGAGGKPGETAGAGETPGGKAAPKIEADRLMKIGGFIGGSSPATLDYSRRTADSTAKNADTSSDMLEQLEEMVSQLDDLLNKDWTVEVEDGLT